MTIYAVLMMSSVGQMGWSYGIAIGYVAVVVVHTVLITRAFLATGPLSPWFFVTTFALVAVGWAGCAAIDRINA